MLNCSFVNRTHRWTQSVINLKHPSTICNLCPPLSQKSIVSSPRGRCQGVVIPTSHPTPKWYPSLYSRRRIPANRAAVKITKPPERHHRVWGNVKIFEQAVVGMGIKTGRACVWPTIVWPLRGVGSICNKHTWLCPERASNKLQTWRAIEVEIEWIKHFFAELCFLFQTK